MQVFTASQERLCVSSGLADSASETHNPFASLAGKPDEGFWRKAIEPLVAITS